VDVTDLSGRLALVTGAASGIGRETALALARRGADLAICDLDEAGLAETAREAEALGRRALARRVDVADRAAMAAFADAVHAEQPAVDVLVNNAGVGLAASFLDTPLEDWDWIVGINLMGVVHGCHFFVPRMVERGRGGHVVNISSMAGYVPSDSLSAYTTTKFAVRGLSEALRAELARHRIGVTAVCPGVINTPIVRSSRARGAAAHPELRERGARAFERRNYPPARVAANILRAIQRNRAVAPISPEAWVFWYLKRFVPGAVHRLARFASDRAAREAAARRG
jgi:NAD(P)-dependent dehydrogenase (short-subunit alcohol dehydrogenase family)